MVLKRVARLLLAASGLALAPHAALAQSIDSTAPVLDVDTAFPLPDSVAVGPFRVVASASARLEYDSNVFAEEVDPVDDFVAVATPRLEAQSGEGTTRLRLTSEAQFRRYFQQTTENSFSAFVEAALRSEIGPSDQITASVGWRRAIEDRGDPEARDAIAIGPRKLDLFGGEINWLHDGPRASFGLRGSASKIGYLSPLDADRDLTLLSARASAGYRMGSGQRLVLVGFVNQRNFDREQDFAGIDRDAVTFGGGAGIRFGEGGILRGEATLGVFRFDPSDPGLSSYTGLSAEASIAYLATRRLAFTLDASNSDVATVRSGAQARTDTTIRLGVQAEARHNFRLQGQVFYRNSQFRGLGVSETTVGFRATAEYRLNPAISLVPSVTYADRSSDLPGEEFERLRGSVELRVRF